jgi:hypothetical protein
VLRREAQQRLECGHWRAAAIEPKHELIDVVRQVLRADAVVRALEPSLELEKVRWTRGKSLDAFLASPTVVG